MSRFAEADRKLRMAEGALLRAVRALQRSHNRRDGKRCKCAVCIAARRYKRKLAEWCAAAKRREDGLTS